MHKPLLLWLTVLLGAALVPTALAGAGAAPRNGEIAFTVQFDTPQLFSVRPNGSNGSGLVNLTQHAGDDYDPMWSPDGRRIAFTSHRSGDDETYVMNAEGSGLGRVTRSRGDDENPTWTPDGRRLVISSQRGSAKHTQIYIVTIASGRAVRLTHEKFFDDWPAISPDGRWIAYTRNKRPYRSGDIVVMRADGRGAKAITHGSSDDWYPTWSADTAGSCTTATSRCASSAVTAGTARSWSRRPTAARRTGHATARSTTTTTTTRTPRSARSGPTAPTSSF